MCMCVCLFRVNFTLEELAPAISAYKHFRMCLHNEYQISGHVIKLEAEAIDLSDIPQCSHYERVKEMVRDRFRIAVILNCYNIGIMESENCSSQRFQDGFLDVWLPPREEQHNLLDKE